MRPCVPISDFLADACYTSWDMMGRWLRFGSLGIALLAVIALGLWRFRPGSVPASGPTLHT